MPKLRDFYRYVIDGCGTLMTANHPLDAELWVSGNVGSLRAHAPTGDTFGLALDDLVDEAERDGRPQALLLLKTMAAIDLLGPSEGSEGAERAADRLAARLHLQQGRHLQHGRSPGPGPEPGPGLGDAGHAEHGEHAEQDVALPRWVDLLGKAAVGDCYLWSDVFGEYSQVFCVFAHADRDLRHGLVCRIDLALGGVIAMVGVVMTDPDIGDAIRTMEKNARRNDGRFETITAEDARHRISAALVAFEDPTLPRLLATGPNYDDEFYGALPLVAQRVSGMPAGDAPGQADGQSVAEVWTMQRRQALVDEFIAARLDGWTDRECARMVAARIVDVSVDILRFPPDRTGPTVVARLFSDVLPRILALPDVAMPEAERVARQWVQWRAESLDLPRKARRQLHDATRTALTAFPRMSRDRKISRHAPYVADLAVEQAYGEELQKILDRRAFAVPFPGHRGNRGLDLAAPAYGLPAGETHVDDLDAGDPAHRMMIVVADRPTHGADQARIDAQTAVVEQLWDDEPAEVWQAARRLTAIGMSRPQVLRRLITVWQRHAPDTPDDFDAPGAPEGLTSDHDADPGSLDAYAAALRLLGAAPARRR